MFWGGTGSAVPVADSRKKAVPVVGGTRSAIGFDASGGQKVHWAGEPFKRDVLYPTFQAQARNRAVNFRTLHQLHSVASRVPRLIAPERFIAQPRPDTTTRIARATCHKISKIGGPAYHFPNRVLGSGFRFEPHFLERLSETNSVRS